MKRSDEFKNAISEKSREIDQFQNNGEMSKAVAAADELNKLVDEYKVELAKESADFKNFKANATQVTTPAVDTAKLRNRAFNKLVFGFGNLTDEERGAYFNVSGSPGQPAQVESIPAKGGYLVPEEQMSTLQEFRKAYVALKDYVTVVSTNTTSGRWATFPAQDLEFQSFAELTNITESDLTFGQATYLIEDKGLIIPLSQQLVNDADVDIISIVGRQLAEGAVKTENKAILNPLNTLITGDTGSGITAATAITSYKKLNQAMFKDLDATYYNDSKIYTNQDGFLWLSDLDDAQNRPLFVPDVVEPNKYRYRGKEIVVIPNSTLPNTEVSTDTFAPFFIGSLPSYITFFERQGMELSTSSELYFRQYGIALRAVIRFGVVVTDPSAMVALKVKL